MPVALAVRNIEVGHPNKIITYDLTVTGNYVTGGDTVDFTKATNPKFLTAPFISRNPTFAEVTNQDTSVGGAGNNAGYVTLLPKGVPNGPLVTWLLKAYQPNGNELGAGAYPAGFLGGQFQLQANVNVGT